MRLIEPPAALVIAGGDGLHFANLQAAGASSRQLCGWGFVVMRGELGTEFSGGRKEGRFHRHNKLAPSDFVRSYKATSKRGFSAPPNWPEITPTRRRSPLCPLAASTSLVTTPHWDVHPPSSTKPGKPSTTLLFVLCPGCLCSPSSAVLPFSCR